MSNSGKTTKNNTQNLKTLYLQAFITSLFSTLDINSTETAPKKVPAGEPLVRTLPTGT